MSSHIQSNYQEIEGDTVRTWTNIQGPYVIITRYYPAKNEYQTEVRPYNMPPWYQMDRDGAQPVQKSLPKGTGSLDQFGLEGAYGPEDSIIRNMNRKLAGSPF